MADLRDPKLQHFIAEHAHPSLQVCFCYCYRYCCCFLSRHQLALILRRDGSHCHDNYKREKMGTTVALLESCWVSRERPIQSRTFPGGFELRSLFNTRRTIRRVIRPRRMVTKSLYCIWNSNCMPDWCDPMQRRCTIR